MAIPKHLKKQLRNDFNRSGESRSLRRTWSYELGDLVKVKHEKIWGVVIECFDSYYGVMTPYGRRNLYPRQLERVQPISKDDI